MFLWEIWMYVKAVLISLSTKEIIEICGGEYRTAREDVEYGF